MDPIEYLRQFRIIGFSIFDFTSAFFGMAVLSPLLSWLFGKAGIFIPKKNWVILTLPISIVAHLLVGRDTLLTRFFLDPNGHILAKVVIVGCFFLGLTGIKRVKPKPR